MKTYYVYILTNHSRTIYIGMTNDLERRLYEHKHKLLAGFTAKYNINQLVYYETAPDILSAIEHEHYLKGWLRKRKIALIESVNPTWKDLSSNWDEG